MTDWVAMGPIGIGEALARQKAKDEEEAWERVAARVTPGFVADFISHTELSGANRPGFAPVIMGLVEAGVPAGSQQSLDVYNYAWETSVRNDDDWDEIFVAGDTKGNYEKAAARIYANQKEMFGENARSYHYPKEAAINPDFAPPGYEPIEDPGYTLFGAIKGTSRWLFLALDAIPEGIDAFGRLIINARQGRITPGEGFAGMIGADPQAAQVTGIPFFSYLRSAIEGERINMGTGWFATNHGEVSPTIQSQLALYDAETHGQQNEKGEYVTSGLTQADFDRRKQKYGSVVVEGLAGATYEARDLAEWKFLRDNAGRAALLAQLQYSDPGQQILGQPHGMFGELYDEATLLRSDQLPGVTIPGVTTGVTTNFNAMPTGAPSAPKNGSYFSHSSGRMVGAAFFEPGSLGFNIVSGATDGGKQLIDLGLVAKGLNTVFSKGGRAVGLAGEAGDLHRGATTIEGILGYADDAARPAAANDLIRGTVNIDAATNALARGADDALQRAVHARNIARRRAARTAAETGATELQIDTLLKRAAKGNTAAQRILRDQGGFGDDLDTVLDVMRRSGVDLSAGRYGTAQVGEEVLEEARRAVEDLHELRTTRKASVFVNADGHPVLTYDADIGRAQQTLFTLYDQIDAQHAVARELVAARGGRGMRRAIPGALRSKAAAIGIDPNDYQKVERLARASGEYIAGRKKALTSNLFIENHTTRMGAANMLGGTAETLEDVNNLTRVLKRNATAIDFLENPGASRRLAPGQLHRLVTGKGAASDLFDSLVDANTVHKVQAILGPSVEFGGRNIPPPMLRALRDATTREEIMDILLDNPLRRILPAPPSLLGGYRKAGTAITVAGGAAGAGWGGYQEAQAGGSPTDILGGVIFGGTAGLLGGSALSGGIGLIGHSLGSEALTRGIQNKADAMGLLLSGTRASTSTLLALAGHEPTRALASLTAPGQMTYAFGHSRLGRRIARHADPEINVGEPTSLFYGLLDYSRVYGFNADEVAHVFIKGSGDDAVQRVLLKSAFKSDDDFAKAAAELLGDGYKADAVHNMDEIFADMAMMTPKNPFDGYAHMRRWAEGVDAILDAKGMNEKARNILTQYTEGLAKEFEGNVNSVGQPADYMQAIFNGQYVAGGSVERGARMMAEQWSGRVAMPDMQKVQRAMMQTDAFGRVHQVITGKGIFGLNGTFWDELLKRGFNPDQVRDWKRAFTPENQRNILFHGTRRIIQTVWSPLMLLSRPLAFLSRVFGEDQGRMLASDMDNMFTHPVHYISAILANYDYFRQKGALRGVTARSAISSFDVYDETGKVVEDFLDVLGNAGLADQVRTQLGIYNRPQMNLARQGGGVTQWVHDIARGDANYIGGVAVEFRQLLTDPMARELAASTADNPVRELAERLINGWERQDGHYYNLVRNWAAQFTDEGVTGAATREFLSYMEDPRKLEAFLYDEWARLHLKTGGDWVLKLEEGMVVDSMGNVIPPEVVAANGWDSLDVGYTIVRRGDDELLDVVANQRIKNVNYRYEDGTTEVIPDFHVRGDLNDQKWQAIKDLVKSKNDSWKGQVGRITQRGNAVPLAQHQFPEVVKGTRTVYPRKGTELAGMGSPGWKALADETIEQIYDMSLGAGSRVISRQPVLGNHYWEDIGVLYPMMDDKTQRIFRGLAEAEGRWDEVAKIADASRATGVATGVLDDFDAIHAHAQTYAIERTKDMLFDLTRERNFIDAWRIAFPFAGPMVEAFEAWSRVLREDPIRIWRRGGQLYNHAWDTSPIALDTEHFWADWAVENPKGMFWTDEDGVEHISVPFSHYIMDALSKIEPGIKPGDWDQKLRGFNVVFGPDDLRATSDPQTIGGLGIPTDALNPGISPALTAVAGPLLQDRDGAAAELEEWMFPYGKPSNWTEMFMPYHLRLWYEGSLGEESRHQLATSTIENFGNMIANGEAGDGDDYDWPMRTAAEVDAVYQEARRRASIGNKVEGVLRGLLPTFVTPEFMVELPKMEGMGVDTEKLLTLGSLIDFAQKLYSEEGAEWYQTKDGMLVSTEGDFEVITMYLNDYFGLDIFSADMLKLPTSKTVHERVHTERSAGWNRDHADNILSEFPESGAFVMPDYAAAQLEEYSFAEREAAIRRGEITYVTEEDIKLDLQARVVALRERHIERQAEYIYGPDEWLTTEERAEKNFYEGRMKEAATGRFAREAIELGRTQKIFDELVTWDQFDWSTQTLTSEEEATVASVLWYLALRTSAYEMLETVDVRDLGNQGRNEEQQQMVEAVIADVERLVAAQYQHASDNNVDMGNFPYLYERFFRSEWVDVPETDALEDLARARILGDAEEAILDPASWGVGAGR